MKYYKLTFNCVMWFWQVKNNIIQQCLRCEIYNGCVERYDNKAKWDNGSTSIPHNWDVEEINETEFFIHCI